MNSLSDLFGRFVAYIIIKPLLYIAVVPFLFIVLQILRIMEAAEDYENRKI